MFFHSFCATDLKFGTKNIRSMKLLNTVAITPKSEDKKCPKVFNMSEFHFSEVTFFQNWYFSESKCQKLL